eukprot:gnl/MRDRNA2_/MRDRNA2_102957_c0_seq1.p1 gnl/MRDRNA2_/MRDRNA2_102957_c0~~gnl/MRDRNA2_/MRDRNA2_102957_c0_seq1.p1  ORF type:complete len:411 (+),score=93.12 gnl/MRDRNA2_/MRDRNA2_102957_c0_seq1:55-1287(+)
MGNCSCFEGVLGGKKVSSKCPSDLLAEAIKGFTAAYGERPTALGCAPGRIEVLGNHTDYNEGFILSAAIDRCIVMVGRKSAGKEGRLASREFQGKVVFRPDAPDKKSGSESWANYVIGVVAELGQQKSIIVPAFDAFVVSNVPPGSGVSSSAALEMATVKLLQQLFPDMLEGLSDLDKILIAKGAENNFVGMGCGILDQFSSGMGKAGQLISLDCRDLSYSYVPLQGAEFVLANTHAPHQLVDGKYNDLRKGCFDSVAELNKLSGQAASHLRDFDVNTFEKHKNKLSSFNRRRSQHIVYENQRVQQGITGLKNGDLAMLGTAMSGSHQSSKNDFGNSCKELDIMVDCAQGLCLGSRLMGGGFGGCTINLCKEGEGQAFCDKLKANYKEKTGIDSTTFICKTAEGAFCEAL